MEQTEYLEPVENSYDGAQYFVSFNVEPVEKQSHKEHDDFHDNDAELHQQPGGVQHRVLLIGRSNEFHDLIEKSFFFL